MAVLSNDSYGKGRVRLLKVNRYQDRHDIKDLTVQILLSGDFETAYLDGDNSNVLPTDTMKNTVYALAKLHPVESVEQFGQVLYEHFLKANPRISKVDIQIAESIWQRMKVGGEPHHHTFRRAGGGEKRVAYVSGTTEARTVRGGIEDLLVLKTTGSGFDGFFRDRFTTLRETVDRILATSIKAVWLYRSPQEDFDATYVGIGTLMQDLFADHQSRSVQHTLYAMGNAVLEQYPQILEIELALPNKHFLPVDLSAFGLENNNEVFLGIDEPYGDIRAKVSRA